MLKYIMMTDYHIFSDTDLNNLNKNISIPIQEWITFSKSKVKAQRSGHFEVHLDERQKKKDLERIFGKFHQHFTSSIYKHR